MTKRDWLTTGIKLLGVYCVIWGAASLTYAIARSLTSGMASGDAKQGLLYFLASYALQPIAYFGLAFVLIRKTEWCVSKIQAEEGPHTESKDGHRSAKSAPTASSDDASA